MSPIAVSPLAEMVPTCAISLWFLHSFDWVFSSRGDLLDRDVDAALDLHRVVPGRDQLEAFGVDRLGEHGGGGGAVAGLVGGLGRDLLHHLRAHVLELVLELDLLGDGDAVLGDRGRAPRLLDDHVAAARAEGDLDGVGEDVDAPTDGGAGALVENDVLGAHVLGSSRFSR
jgi:hypothetical protein